MSDNDAPDDFEGAEEQRKGKKGSGDKAGAGAARDQVVVSDAAQKMMQERGVSLSEILRNWKHLGTKEVAVRLAEFGSAAAKASAHIAVSFTRDAGYALVTTFIKQVQKLSNLAQRLTIRNQPRNDKTLG